MSQVKRLRFLEIDKAVLPLTLEKSKVALHMIAVYTDGAVEQWERILEDEKIKNEQAAMERVYDHRGDKKNAKEHRHLVSAFVHQQLLDFHYYFVCAHKVHELMNAIVEQEKTQGLKRFWNDWEPRLSKFSEPRQWFEHPQKYLRGSWKKAYFGLYLFKDELQIQDSTYDLKEVGVKNLEEFFDELMMFLLSPNPQHQPRNREDFQHP